MKHRYLSLMISLLLCVMPALGLAQSGQEFEDPSGTYKLALQGDWKAVSYNDAVGRPKTEFVYRDRREGLLKVSKETLNGTLADMVKQEEENLRVYRPGFERAASEVFGGGALSGMRLSFFSTDSGRQTASTFYFLKDNNTVFVLRFTGKRGSLDTIRNLTDQMARSFQPIAKK